jgi:DNA-binding winged helix-turn-helix (wHTH) protein
VWRHDFFGGTRTVDVHVRRLRAKLGPEHEQLIATVRNVGYKFVRPGRTINSQQRAPHQHATNAATTHPDPAARKSPQTTARRAIDSGLTGVAPAAAPS